MNRFFTRISITLLSLSLCINLHTHCMLSNIAATDVILRDNYKYLSLVDGAIAWETGVIRRLYDFGQNESKLVRIIRALFYRIPGFEGETDFGVTTQLASEDPDAVITQVAEIIMQCVQLKQQHNNFQKAISRVDDLIHMIVDAGWLSNLGKSHESLARIMKDAQEKPWDQNASDLFISTCKTIAQKLEKELGEDILLELNANKEIAAKFFKLTIASAQNLKNLFKVGVFKEGKIVNSFILEALNECDPNNIEALYPEHTLETVLLAFVYKKYSGDRTTLKNFYDVLNTKLDKKILVFQLNEQWINTKFDHVEQAGALRIVEGIFADQSIEKEFAMFTYSVFQIRAFPSPVGYEKATYQYKKDKRTKPFSDCMDNTMRNFINLYAYDAEENKFTLEKLLINMNLKIVHSNLVYFLKLFGDVNMTTSIEAHNVWLNVISNIPYVNYRSKINGATGDATRSESGKGYILVPENEKTNELLLDWLKKNNYRVVEKNDYCYELRASVKNIIIVLNHLLKLNLFADAGGLAKEFMRPDFIAFYFPKLCDALKATNCFMSTQPSAEQGELDINFDALDYTDSHIYMTLNLAEIICTFITVYGHGDLTLVTAEGSPEEPRLKQLLKKINYFPDEPSLSLLITNVLCKQKMSFNHLKDNPEYLYINLFATPLENTRMLKNIVQSVISEITDTTPLKIKMRIKDLLLRLAEKQPDIEQRQIWILSILQSFVIRLSDENINNNDVDTIRLLKEALQTAQKEVASNWIMKERALKLFKVLVEKGQWFQEATQAAEEEITNPKVNVREAALNLFKALVEKNQSFVKAIQAAVKGINNEEQQIILSALNLFKALVEKDQGFEKAAQAAAKEITSSSKTVSRSAFNIFTALIEKNQNFKEATQAAEKGITSQELQTRVSALDLFKDLVEKDQAFVEAAQAAQQGIADQDLNARSSALDIFKALVEKGQAIKEAIQAAKQGIADQNWTVKSSALVLFKQLIIKVPDETKTTIQKLLDDPSIKLTDDMRHKLGELLKK